MKNQYFGDINGYRKYGLLRALQSNWAGRLLVAWMLIHDDTVETGDFVLTSVIPTLGRRTIVNCLWV